jgi:CubicO group peptidase (beta-lactamase class C family)
MKTLFWSLSVLILLVSCNNQKSVNLEPKSVLIQNKIPSTTYKQLGIDSLLMNKLTSKIKNQEYPNIHSVLIAKNGHLVYEHYFKGQDQVFGKDLGVIQHTDSTLHDMRSITKSVVSGCIGIAIDKGFIKSVDQKIADFFPELKSIFKGEKANWTIENYLTMMTGLDWNEDLSYDNPENDEFKMTYSKDPVLFVLNKPLNHKSGETFNYNGGTTQVLAKIIERASKMPLDTFVKKYLFDPLEIEKFEWIKYSFWKGNDEFAAASGLRLTSRDMMKIGLLYGNEGKWNKRQVISSQWVKESFAQRIEFPSAIAEGNDAYGYQFWMWSDDILDNELKIVAAIGNGGQTIFWDLQNDIIVVTTSGNYNKWGIKNDPYALLRNEIYPLILK